LSRTCTLAFQADLHDNYCIWPAAEATIRMQYCLIAVEQ